MPFFSVVVAARDAAATLPVPIESLRRQTFSDWEAIVVDDGSGDATAAIVAAESARDARFRLISATAPSGVSAARNRGLAAAAGEWLLFLDADDSLLPDALSAWHRGIAADPSLDVVCGRWVRVAPDGRIVTREQWPITRDMFPVFARLSAFAIHSCVARRALVVAAGGFDTSYVTCEDWDLWQRLARAGASFGSINDEVARYHMRRGSASLAARQMLVDGLRVIECGHSSDPRVPSPVPRYANGMASDDPAAVRFGYACWPAGLILGSGDEAAPLLDLVGSGGAPDVDASVAADALFRSATLPLCSGPEGWNELWPAVSSRLTHFVDTLERRTGAVLLSRRILTALGRLILEAPAVDAKLTSIGRTMGHTIDIHHPCGALPPPRGIERVVVRVHAGSERIGSVELPVCDRRLDGDVVADAIAAEYGWGILGRFFEATVYREVVRRGREGALQAVRRHVVLGSACDGEKEWSARRHDLVGWTVFLQELWGRSDLAAGSFYDAEARDADTTTRTVEGEWITVEVLDPPCDWTLATNAANVELAIAGVPVCVIKVDAENGTLRHGRLRALLTTAAGVELVHVAVREGLIGQAWDGSSLREHVSRRRRRALSEAPRAESKGPARAAALVAADRTIALVGARRHGPPGSAASRRAALTARVRRDVFDAAQTAGEPVVNSAGWRAPRRLAYMPELLWDGAQQPVAAPATDPPDATPFGRHHFESLFASGSDPWRYTTPYEARKYEQTLSLVGSEPIERALEIGCAEGHFSDVLASRVGALVAADISAIALDRAAQRCAAHANVSFANVDLAHDALPGNNDLIVCSEVLYYVGTVDDLRQVASKLRDALRDGGRLITAHANVASDDPSSAGYLWDVPFGVRTIRQVLSATPGLQLSREMRTRLYSVLEFERSDHSRQPAIVDADFAMPEPSVAASICWDGGGAAVAAPSPGSTLPILMYHRVSDEGAAATARYRVSPREFQRQLTYLRDAGFRSVSLAEWMQAMLTRQPLAGRRVALTFDDGYEDFVEAAWPLLRQYGFGATLFVVTDRVGGHNTWDRALGESLRLMDWSAVRRVAAEGVEIGAHSATHPPMTALTPAEIVREASRARAEIQRQIEKPATAFAYPYGDSDAVVQHLVGGCGFLTGVTCRFGISGLHDRPLRLPRIEISGADSLTDFIRKVGGR